MWVSLLVRFVYNRLQWGVSRPATRMLGHKSAPPKLQYAKLSNRRCVLFPLPVYWRKSTYYTFCIIYERFPLLSDNCSSVAMLVVKNSYFNVFGHVLCSVLQLIGFFQVRTNLAALERILATLYLNCLIFLLLAQFRSCVQPWMFLG